MELKTADRLYKMIGQELDFYSKMKNEMSFNDLQKSIIKSIDHNFSIQSKKTAKDFDLI